MPTEIAPPRISSNMAPSQPIAGEKIQAGRREKAKAACYEDEVDHHRKPQIERQW
jgi:hypothetical protein